MYPSNTTRLRAEPRPDDDTARCAAFAVRSGRGRLALYLLGAGGTALVLLTTSRFGSGLSPDSAHYVAAARHLLSEGRFLGYDGEPFVAWPPLYPVVLAVPGLVGLDAPVAARLINAFAFGATIVLAGVWLERYAGSATLGLLGGLCVLLTVPLFDVATMVWSEAVFIVLLQGCLLLIAGFGRGVSVRRLLGASVLAGLALLTRHMGFTLVATGVLCVWLAGESSRARRFGLAAVFLVVSTAPAAGWIAWNHFTTGAVAGERGAADQTFFQNAVCLGRSLVECVMMDGYARGGRRNVVVAGIFMGGLVAGPAWLVWTLRRRGGQDFSFPILSVALFANLYVISLFVLALRVPMDPINTRLLAPVLAPVALLILSIMHYDFTGRSAAGPAGWSIRRAQVMAVLGASVFIALALMSGFRYGQRIQAGLSQGVNGFSMREWRDSRTMAYLRRYPPGGEVFSNWPDAVYVLTGRTARLSPRRVAGFHDDRLVGPEDIQSFRQSCNRTGSACLVWHVPHHRRYLYEPDELKSFCKLEMVRVFPDGVIYACSGSPASFEGHDLFTGHDSHEYAQTTARQYRAARP